MSWCRDMTAWRPLAATPARYRDNSKLGTLSQFLAETRRASDTYEGICSQLVALGAMLSAQNREAYSSLS